MIDALISGRIYGQPAERTSKAGSRFATCKVRVAMRGDETAWINVVAFSATAVEALLALGDGDSVSLAGELKVSTYTDKTGATKPSLDLLAHAVLSAYDVKRRRKASSSEQTSARADGVPFNDEIPI